MLKNYFTITLRNLIRHRAYSIINIFGLTVGLATSIFIFLWVMDEISFDKFHANAGNIYRVMINHTYPDGRIATHGATSALLKGAIQTEVPEVDIIAQLDMGNEALIKHDINSFNEQGMYADPELFSILSFPLVKGDHSNALPDISSIVISEKLAGKLFGNDDPIGKSLQVNQSHEFKITGVFADVPKNSTLQFDFVLPFELYAKENPWTQHWRSGGTRTLITLKPGASLENANAKLAGLIKKNCEDCTASAFLFQYAQSRLYSKFENGKSAGGRIEQVKLFSVVAVIVLVMACINFMNLATARSATRSREVGVRKIIGAKQAGLIAHFMAESVLMSFAALLLALAVVQLLLPFFNEITDKSVQMDFSNPVFVAGTLAITLICGLLAGSYPAFFLSSFNPLVVLKGNAQTSLSGNGLRRALVVVQFATSIVLIAGSIIIYKQITFISHKNLGFEKENVIVIDRNEDIGKNHTAFKNDLLQLSSVKNIGFGGSNVFTIPITTTDPVWPGKPENSSINFKIFRCDEGFIPTMNIELLAGRNFSDIDNRDTSNYIINKKAMEVMGLSPENVIGTDLEMWTGKGKIVGLTNDFHNDNLREGIEPLIFLYSENLGWHYFIRVDGRTPVNETLAAIESTFKKYSPDYPFEYSFLDEVFDREYRTEAVIGRLSLSFTTVAVLISCLGLFGLASFAAERRTKELGIRKVMGASASNLAVMLCGDFTKLVAIGLLIGIPIAWYLGSDYLAGYAFHAKISVWIFALTATGTLLIALITVAYQSIKAALANPVESLRSE
ncbi:MAG: ABC transporter permease [Cyclobacteriaceae bacterium]|nr:ABC transporter permease [Cyclobacteriaceae bacterium]